MNDRTDESRTTAVPTALIERVLVGGNHLALLIGADHPPYAMTHEAALEHYRQNHDGYEAWCCWRTIMELRDAVGW